MHRLVEPLDGEGDVVVRMCGGHERRLVWRGREVHTSIERRMKELSELLGVGGLRVGEAPHRLAAEEKAPHASRGVGSEWYAVPRRARDKTLHECRRSRRDTIVQRRGERIECSDAGRHRSW